jgi:sugar transferase (PEP-CTERM/EpsH1 system associated)
MNILWLKTELLHPVDKGGKIRTYNMLKELKRDHHVTYLTLDDGSNSKEGVERASEYCHRLIRVPHRTSEKYSMRFYTELAGNLASPLPYALSKYRNAEMSATIDRTVAQDGTDLLICDFLAPAVNLSEMQGCRTVLFQHNVEAMIWKRHYQLQTNQLKKAYLFDQYRKMRRFERTACGRFDHVVAVSADDGATMKQEYGISNVDDVPTGVDTGYFSPSGAAAKRPNRLVFTGSMDWLPNEDAILWFVEKVLPLVRLKVPGAELTVVGRNPTPRLVELANRDSLIDITGRVDDVRPYMDEAAAYVVPIRIGGGTRLKIYEAMAMEQPIVSTTVGAEGLPVRDGEHLLIADSPDSFAESVVRVLTDCDLATRLGQASAALVRNCFGWHTVTERFIEIVSRPVKNIAENAKAVANYESAEV